MVQNTPDAATPVGRLLLNRISSDVHTLESWPKAERGGNVSGRVSSGSG